LVLLLAVSHRIARRNKKKVIPGRKTNNGNHSEDIKQMGRGGPNETSWA
jgi:hypothetical protein